jgi:DNA-binding NtrC family response regulator
MQTLRVLILDDERLVRWSLAERLRADGFDPIQASTVAEAVDLAGKGVDAAILDFKLPDGDGVSVLKRLRHVDPDLPVIMLTAHTDLEIVVDAMKAGASDYLAKPFDVKDVSLRLQRAVEATGAHRELRRLKEDLARPFTFDSLIGASQPMQQVRELARKVARSPASTVLLTGESGTGKDLLAKVIHYASSRAAKSFLNITCSALPETLLESELFGHERGAFTDARKRKAGLFELAGTGTIFLDEIHQMPLALQPKLLRVLESRRVRLLGGSEEIEIKCRLIAAANPLLEHAVATGAFREDLFYRLNVFTITLPALRERQEDISLIARQCLAESVNEHGRVKVLSPAALETLHTHRWPGNVRELRNIIERAAILSGEERNILPEHLLIQRRTAGPAPDSVGEIRFPRTGKTLASVEREAIQIALRITNGNRSAAARMLGISRPRLARKLRDVEQRLDNVVS